MPTNCWNGSAWEPMDIKSPRHSPEDSSSGLRSPGRSRQSRLFTRPRVLLLDEPSSDLDPEYTTEVLDIVNELKEEGLDFIIVTHEMGFARHACEKAAFLCEGKLMEYGSSSEIFDAPKSEQLKNFLGRLLEWNM